MRKSAFFIIVVLAGIGIVLAIRGQAPRPDTLPSNAQAPAPQETLARDAAPATGQTSPARDASLITGQVVETMNAGGYTYVYVDAGDKKVWAAGPEMDIKAGATVSFVAGMQMRDFHSETLDRTFDAVYFVSTLLTGAPQLPMGHPNANPPSADIDGMDFSGIQVPPGGKAIVDLYTAKSDLVGQQVVVRGKVVKFTSAVLGKNWIHLRDGTGTEGQNDLTVTTQAQVAIGDLIRVQGALTVDKDFGAGYAYDIIIEDASVTVEQTAANARQL